MDLLEIIMMIFSMLPLISFIAFPESSDAILAKYNKESINIETSGNLGIYYKGKCHMTYGNETLTSDDRTEWCSNIPKSSYPWIQYSIKGKQIKATKYSIRNGCCKYYSLCCTEEDGVITDYFCCCKLYSFSLQASNDNKTWKVLHKVEKDRTIDYCVSKTYDIKEPSVPYTYYRIALDEEYPGCPRCMQINQFEVYGETIDAGYSMNENVDDEESISIIGRVKKGE